MRSQEMYSSFVMPLQSTLVGRERHQTLWGRDRPYNLYLFGLGGIGAALGHHQGQHVQRGAEM